jgi:hypothetical protein
MANVQRERPASFLQMRPKQFVLLMSWKVATVEALEPASVLRGSTALQMMLLD